MILQLGIIFGILGFLISPFGLMAMLIGLLGFILLPMISTVSSWKAPANFFLSLATFPIKRAAIVVSEHNDGLFKTMRFSGLGVEMITIDGEEKAFEDPDNALHHFLGIPFALADEEHGVLFDPRHAAAGEKKKGLQKTEEDTYLATEEEWQSYDIAKWMPAVFEFDTKHELVDLSAVQSLIQGGERSEYAQRVEELYQHSRDPFGDGTSAMKYLYPMIAFAITFGGIWFMVSQFGLPTGGGGPSSVVGYGSFLFLAGMPGSDDDESDEEDTEDAFVPAEPTDTTQDPLDIDHSESETQADESDDSGRELPDMPDISRSQIAIGAGILIPIALLALSVVFLGPILTVSVVLALVIGFLTVPALTFLSQISQAIGGLFTKLYFKLGFFGYRQPILCWTPSKYVVKELDEIEHTGDIEYYSVFGHTIGVTFEPGPDSWGPDVVEHRELESRQPVTDGGNSLNSNLPNKYLPSDLKRDNYGKYIPKRIRDNKYYVDAAMVVERFNGSADGDKSLKKLLEAKEIHGSGSDGIDDSTVFKASMFMGVLGLILGLGIFVLPAFL